MKSLCSLVLSAVLSSQAAAQPLVKEGRTVKISQHVYVIPDELAPMVPNVGIVVGNRATLVVDPGMGRRSGEAGLPASARIVRAAAQQQDIEEMGMKWVENFASRSPQIAEVLQGITGFRPPAEVFDREKTLDLGGVRVRLVWLGPGHTRGDTVFFGAQRLVPAHGEMTDAAIIGQYRAYLASLRTRVAELKRAGTSSDEAAQLVAGEFRAKYPDWAQPLRIVAAANAIYAELP